MAIIIQFIERSMDYVERQLKLLEVATETAHAAGEEKVVEFAHVSRSADFLSRFMEGSSIYQLFTKEELNKFVNMQLAGGTWDFVAGLQQYTFAPFTVNEILEIASGLAFAIAPNKTLSNVPKELMQSPTGSEAVDNTPEDVEVILHANPWLMPLCALALSRDIPMFMNEGQ